MKKLLAIAAVVCTVFMSPVQSFGDAYFEAGSGYKCDTGRDAMPYGQTKKKACAEKICCVHALMNRGMSFESAMSTRKGSGSCCEECGQGPVNDLRACVDGFAIDKGDAKRCIDKEAHKLVRCVMDASNSGRDVTHCAKEFNVDKCLHKIPADIDAGRANRSLINSCLVKYKGDFCY